MTPQEQQEEWRKRRREMTQPGLPCSITQPLWMVIPDDGIIIPCPVHTEGHFIAPNSIIC